MYKLNNNGWPSRLSDGAFVNPENNQDYLDWLAAGNTPLPADPLPNPRIQEVKKRLAEIDTESIRALRAKALGKDKAEDTTKLTNLENEAAALRTELAAL